MKLRLSVFLIIVLTASAAFASSCPTVDGLATIEMSKRDPLNISMDQAGKLYATDNYDNKLLIYNKSGELSGSLKVVGPLGVAVDDPSGKIYVGNAIGKRGFFTGEVTVYDKALNPLYKLGGGAGEFKYPSSIAVGSGRVYVADKQDNLVKAYDAQTGQKLFQFGGYGTANGALVQPNAIAISPVTGNLLVTDHAIWYDSSSAPPAWLNGAKVHEFTATGQFVRKFGSYGYAVSAGVIATPSGVAVDSTDRVYVSDMVKNTIHVFAPGGTALCMMRNIYEPKGLLSLSDGRLYAARLNAVSVYGLDDYVLMGVSPGSLSFEAQKCGGNPSPRSVTITNSGKGVLNWSIASTASWLVPASTAGQVSAGGSVVVDVSAVADSLSVGSHSGSLNVYKAGAFPETVAAELKVYSQPTLAASPSMFIFTAKGAQTPSGTATVNLLGDRAGTARWNAQANAGWIGLSPSSGGSNNAVAMTVSVNPAGLEPGRYEGIVTVSACAAGSPVDIAVTLDYVQQGSISVSTNLAGATFTISGPATYAGSGTSALFENVPDGTYTINFGRVAGFRTPASYSLGVSAGQSVQFTGTYADLRKNNDILASSNSTRATASVSAFDGATGAPLGVLNLLGAGYRIESTASGDVDGDGQDEIIVSVSYGSEKGLLRGFKLDGTPLAWLNFSAFGKYAADLSVGDLDGDGKAEIIAGTVGDSSVPPLVKVYREGSAAGLYFRAFGGTGNGVQVDAADFDGDGIAEIAALTLGNKGSIDVAIWKVNGSTASKLRSFSTSPDFLQSVGSKGDTFTQKPMLAAADLDGDGIAEVIISGIKNSALGQAVVMVYGAGGSMIRSFDVNSYGGVNLAAGDTDFDGEAEIIVGDGLSSLNAGLIRVYKGDGTLRGTAIKAFNNFGAIVCLGRFE